MKKGGRWIGYAVRALVVRFWDLAKVNFPVAATKHRSDSFQKADSLDILLVLLGYILMHITFGRLFLSSRSLGSNFWLMTAILSSSVTAFLLTLPLAMYLNIPLDPVCLVEALPFLVCTVGFDKPLRLARAVFTHPHVTRPAVQEGRWRGQMKLAGDVVLEAVDQVGNGILRDYALEIAVLLVGASSHVGGLREFCALAVLALTLDCFMLCTFYTAILAVMIEVSSLDHGTFPRWICSQLHRLIASLLTTTTTIYLRRFEESNWPELLPDLAVIRPSRTRNQAISSARASRLTSNRTST